MIEVNPCPKCGSDNIQISAFSILPDVIAKCEDCEYNIDVQVPWEDMNEEEHDEKSLKEVLEIWNKQEEKS
ncbi:hypothetical protein TMUPMC115_0930 [Tetragenococcus muriaticus PMC-11-5]|uniref:Uncharacterized protein n=1 Tax=Tetragenococcus muriaticus PMC-11-5 TaxID=1302649 RepID=A0A091CDS8_9ENTE